MNLYAGMGKGERNRIKTRVRTAMNAQVALDGKYQGGRPPYGYRLADADADAGPHPNPAKAADGRRLHVLEPHPDYAQVVQRIFADFLAGSGIKVIATTLTDEGIPSPSAADPNRNRHRTSSQGARGQSAIRAILKNPANPATRSGPASGRTRSSSTSTTSPPATSVRQRSVGGRPRPDLDRVDNAGSPRARHLGEQVAHESVSCGGDLEGDAPPGSGELEAALTAAGPSVTPSILRHVVVVISSGVDLRGRTARPLPAHKQS